MHGSAAWPASPVRQVMEREQFSAGQLKAFSGNGMHLLTQASWCLYVWSHCRVKQKDVFTRMPFPEEVLEISDVETLDSYVSEKNGEISEISEISDADNVDAKNDEDGKEVGDGEPAVKDASSDELPNGRWREDSEDEEELGSFVGFCDKRQRDG